jgi:LDH2 family malate/lactate/ureidoglycolate dehydrogenase
MTSRPLILPARTLRELSQECFERLGLSREDAFAVADVLIDANLRGIESHGFQRVPIYMRRVSAGLSGGTEGMTVSAEWGCLCRMDARQALGPAAGVKAVDHAIGLSRSFGVGLVAVGHSTHFGPAGYYARRACGQGLVAVVASNAPKTMAPYGAAEPFIGTNPVAVAIPLGRAEPFVLDMAASIVARGKIIRAATLGESIPEGLAIDLHGRPTTDAHAALAGSVLPFGGAKGSGLALAVTMLAGILADADFDDEMASMYDDWDRPQNVGHLFLVIDPARLEDPRRASERLEALVDRLHALRPVEGCSSVLYAGEPEARLYRERSLAGVPIKKEELQAVAEVCLACGLHDLADRAMALLGAAGAAT